MHRRLLTTRKWEWYLQLFKDVMFEACVIWKTKQVEALEKLMAGPKEDMPEWPVTFDGQMRESIRYGFFVALKESSGVDPIQKEIAAAFCHAKNIGSDERQLLSGARRLKSSGDSILSPRNFPGCVDLAEVCGFGQD